MREMTVIKDPLTAIFLSLICPGLGHVYLNKKIQGQVYISVYLFLMMFLSLVLLFKVKVFPHIIILIVPFLLLFYFYVVFKSYQEAQTISRNVVQEVREKRVVLIVGIFIMVFFLNGPLIIQRLLSEHVVQIFHINSDSMLPTLNKKDFFLIHKNAYQFNSPQRGDIVVFIDPRSPQNYLIKRLVALGGEEVEIKEGKILINGQLVLIPGAENIIYLNRGFFGQQDQKIKIPPVHFFVLGDNSLKSNDSRFWGFLSGEYIVGKALKFLTY